MTEDTKDQNITAEQREAMKDEVSNLTPAQRKVYGELITEQAPKPEIDWANMPAGEFQKRVNDLT